MGGAYAAGQVTLAPPTLRETDDWPVQRTVRRDVSNRRKRGVRGAVRNVPPYCAAMRRKSRVTLRRLHFVSPLSRLRLVQTLSRLIVILQITFPLVALNFSHPASQAELKML